jgi:hypothetical protein
MDSMDLDVDMDVDLVPDEPIDARAQDTPVRATIPRCKMQFESDSPPLMPSLPARSLTMAPKTHPTPTPSSPTRSTYED